MQKRGNKNMKSSRAYIEYKLNQSIYIPSDKLREQSPLDSSLQQGHPIAPDEKFPPEYFEKHHATREGGSHGMRGDNRSPEELNYTIQPKCSYPQTKPHYDLTEHRGSSDCSGFASLTRDAGQARDFGKSSVDEVGSFYTYSTKVEDGFRVQGTFNKYPKEDETSSVTPTPIDSFRQCRGDKFTDMFNCGNIFVRAELDQATQEKLVSAQLTPYEKERGVKASKP